MSRINRPSRIYNILVKSHKLTVVHVALPPTTKMEHVKEETLSALKSEVARDALDVLSIGPPEIDVRSTDDFELCRGVKEKGRFTGTFEVLDPKKSLRDSGISGWEAVFVQFRDPETGNLLPITFTLPPTNDEEEMPFVMEAVKNKGKRKASVELDEAALNF